MKTDNLRPGRLSELIGMTPLTWFRIYSILYKITIDKMGNAMYNITGSTIKLECAGLFY